MTLEGKFRVVYNLKRIQENYEEIRHCVPFQEDELFLLTDITYLLYGSGKKAYISTIKDSSTNEFLAPLALS